jgi:hypothetical protein
MAKLTPKENFMRIGYGETPEYVPAWRMGMPGKNAAILSAGPMQFTMPPLAPGEEPRNFMSGRAGEWKDMWGVPYVSNAETGFAGLPKPGVFILEDINHWDKTVKWPRDIKSEVASTDWDALASDGLKNIDRTQFGVLSQAGFGPFQALMGLMGFTEGLCALLEEPEACKELLNYMCDYYVPIVEKVVDYYKPDILYLGDDTASKYAPFFSMEVYRDIFKPLYIRMTEYGVSKGIPIALHNCGKADAQAEDFVEIGVRYWDPAQTVNYLAGIKEKYKGKLAIMGGWDFVPNPSEPITEELVRQSVRDSIDKFAPGGGYAFAGGYLGTAETTEFNAQITEWIQDEVAVYGADYYK